MIDAGAGANVITVWDASNLIRTGNGNDQFIFHGGANIVQDSGGANQVQADRGSATAFITTRATGVTRTGAGTLITQRSNSNALPLGVLDAFFTQLGRETDALIAVFERRFGS